MRAIALFLCAATPLLFPADRILRDQTSSTLAFRRIAVPRDALTLGYATRRARDFLAQNSQLKMIQLTLVPDEKAATYALFGCDHCHPYSFWRIPWDATTSVAFPVAELMSIEGNAVLRYRDRSGNVSVRVIQGSDPRQIRIGEFQGRIINVEMHGYIQLPYPHLYIVGSGTILSKDGASYARDIATRLVVHESWIELRADPWFIDEIWTPFMPLFDAVGPPPTEEAFKKTKTPWCSSWGDCSWTGALTLP
jgi:hypothetical protein